MGWEVVVTFSMCLKDDDDDDEHKPLDFPKPASLISLKGMKDEQDNYNSSSCSASIVIQLAKRMLCGRACKSAKFELSFNLLLMIAFVY